MKAKNSSFAKLFMAMLLLFRISSTVFSQAKQNDNTIRITAKELHSMPVSQFINAKTDHLVNNCIVTVEVEKDVKEYKVQNQAIPGELKAKLATVNSGQTIIVDRRIAIVDGKEKKLQALVYSIVER